MAELKPYSLEDAQELVKEAEKASKTRHLKWRNFELIYRTGQATPELLNEAQIENRLWGEHVFAAEAINMTLPHLNIIIETVAANDPELNVTPTAGGEDTEVYSRVAQALLRYQWKRLNITGRVLRSMTQDAVVIGNGFGKVGWHWEGEEVDRDAPDVEAELADLMEADRRDRELSAELDEETGEKRYTRELASADELAERIMLTESRTLVDEPYVEYVSPYDILVPPDARRIEETPWVAQRLVISRDEVEARDDIYNKQAIEGLCSLGRDDSEQHRGDEEGQYNAGARSSVHDRVELFEFYDMRTRRLLVFQENAEHALYDEPLPYGHRHTPFVHLRNFDDGGSRFWCFGDLENIATLQYQLNEFWTEQLDNAERAGNKYLGDKSAFTSEVKHAIETAAPDTVIPVDTNDRPLNELVFPLERLPLPADVYGAKMDAKSGMAEILGLNEFQQGGSGADRMSATAAAVVDGAATLRANGKRRSVEDAAAQIGLLLLLLDQEFLPDDQAVRISGPSGAVWEQIGPDDLRGEYLVQVKTGSLNAVNPSTRQQRAMELANTLLPLLTDQGYDTSKLVRHIVSESGLDPDIYIQQIQEPPLPGPGTGEGGAPPGSPVDGGVGGAPLQEVGGPPVADIAQQAGEIAL